ncbi:hypothetical protein [Microbacterium sp. CPCC 204701]|uniref:hypothetical protein n=1 Tax=Microbacterium sp. CPCC 204701 TaxID=2493084 RepID=UPI000FDC7068|nr:hypothetical protein [Microbacterium sp. CPCC 204701]
MNKRKFIAAGAALGLVATLFATGHAANAEPVSPGLSVVGSDTLQDVVNALANGTQITGSAIRTTGGSTNIGAFDATGSVLIQTKAAGPRFGRPNGSTDGIIALSRSIDGGNYTARTPGSPTVAIPNQVDIARSSSGPASGAGAGSADPMGPLRFIQFGRDALAYAYTGGTAAWANIDHATLTDIFDGGAPVSIDGVQVTAVIPQAGSGTRQDWLNKLIGANDYPNGGTVPAGILVGQEHDTTHLADGSNFPTNAIIPISAAQWVAQNTGAGIDRRGPGAQIGSPIAGVAAVTGSGSSAVPNQAYYSNTTWGRDTYIVVENARVTLGDAKYNAGLANAVSNAASKLGNHGALQNQAGAVKRKFGFLAPSSTTPIRAKLR